MTRGTAGPLGQPLLHQRRVDEAGSDGVDADAIGSVLPRSGLGQPHHAVLGGGIALELAKPRIEAMLMTDPPRPPAFIARIAARWM